MDKRKGTATYKVLHDWRTSILNAFLAIVVIASIPALATVIVNETTAAKSGFLAYVLIIVELALIVLAVFSRINYRVRVSGLLLIGYIAAIVNLFSSGLKSVAPLYLVLISIVGLLLIGKRISIVVTVLSALLLTTFVFLIDRGLLVPRNAMPNSVAPSLWMTLASTLMILAVAETLLLLFYRFQERVIADERHAREDLVNAHMLLEKQNVELEQKIKKRTDELVQSNKIQTALYKIADTASSSRVIQEFYSQVHRIIGELMYAGNFFIATYDESTDLLSYPYYVDEKDDDFPTRPMGNVHNLTSYIIRTGNTVKHGQEEFKELQARNEYVLEGSPNEDGIGAPLKSDGKVIGAIYVQSYNKDLFYTEQDDEILAFVAQYIATALTRFRAVESERQRVDEQVSLYSIAEAISKTLDIKSVAHAAGENLQKIFDADAVSVLLLDDQQNLITSYYEFDKNEGGYINYVEPFPLGTGLSSKVISTGKPLLLRTLEEEIANGAYFPPELVEQGSGTLSQSWLGVPIIANERVLGLVFLADYKPHAYDKNHLRFLQTISSNISIAIENARLFQAEKKRVVELAAINTVSSALISELDLDALIKLAGEQTRNTFGADIAYVALLDEASGEIKFPYTYGEELTPIKYGEGVTSTIIKNGKPLLINQDLGKHVLEMGATVIGKQSLSYLGVPITVSGKTVGVLSVQSTHKEGIFNEDNLHLLNTIAANLSTAVQTAGLFTRLQSQKKFSDTLIETSPVAIVILDRTNKVTSWNPAAERLFGYTQAEAEGQFIVDLVSDKDTRSEALGFSDLIIEGKAVHSFVERHSKGGGILDLELFAVPVIFEGTRVGTFAIYHDITELKHAQAAIQESERRLADIIDFLPDATLVIDREGRVIAWNRAIEEMTGIAANDMLGKSNYEYALPFYGERRPILIDLVLLPLGEFEERQYVKIKREGETLTGETYTPGLKKEERYLFATATPLHDTRGNIVGAVETIRDITDRKQAEEELQKAKESADAANQAKSAFLANMSHELRTPLNAIIGFTRIVRRKGESLLPEKQIENLDKVITSADHLLNLINTVLDIAKIEAGRMDVLAANFRINDLIDLCINTAQPLVRPNVVLKKEVDENLSIVHSDQDKIRQIILNLLSNAAKFTHEGIILLAAKRDGLTYLQISVSDTGIGISPEALPRIFKEFQQADTSTTRQYGGTGLGLTISRNLSHLLGGELTVTSEPGKGSTFSLTIPIQFGYQPTSTSDALPPGDSFLEPGHFQEPNEMGSQTIVRKRILVIDNDPNAVTLLQDNLNQQEFDVIGAGNGTDGLRIAREQQPQAILLDIIMPGSDGWQILHDLKEDPVTGQIPVILLTILDKKALGFQLGASAYLLKPLDPIAVKEALNGVIVEKGLAQKHVLVVDDDPTIADMLSQFLPESDFKLYSALDGVSALQVVEADRPDILLLDILMPRLDGFGVIANLRANPQTRDLPIIVLSAKELNTAETAWLKETVAMVIEKQGFEGEKLVEEINRLLDKT